MKKIFLRWAVKFRAFGMTFANFGDRDRIDDDVRAAVALAVDEVAALTRKVDNEVVADMTPAAVSLITPLLQEATVRHLADRMGNKTIINDRGIFLGTETEG